MSELPDGAPSLEWLEAASTPPTRSVMLHGPDEDGPMYEVIVDRVDGGDDDVE